MLRFVYLVIFEVTTYLESLDLTPQAKDPGGLQGQTGKLGSDPTQPGQVGIDPGQVETH